MDITVQVAGKLVRIRNMNPQVFPRFRNYLAKEDASDRRPDHEICLSLE